MSLKDKKGIRSAKGIASYNKAVSKAGGANKYAEAGGNVGGAKRAKVDYGKGQKTFANAGPNFD